MKKSSLVGIQEDVHSPCAGDIYGTSGSKSKYISFATSSRGKKDDRDRQLRSIPRCLRRIKLVYYQIKNTFLSHDFTAFFQPHSPRINLMMIKVYIFQVIQTLLPNLFYTFTNLKMLSKYFKRVPGGTNSFRYCWQYKIKAIKSVIMENCLLY